MLIVPIGLSAGLLPWIIKEKRWKDNFILPSVYHAEFHHMCIISP